MKLVIFDIDGTLVDSQHLICGAVHQVYDRHGLPKPARERVLALVGLSLPDTFTRLADGAAHPIEAMVESYREAFSTLRAQPNSMEPLYPGAEQALLRLAKRDDIVLGIATGKSMRGIEVVLGHYRLLPHFTTIQCADTAPSKPDPGMVLNALRQTAVAADNAVLIGDSIYDMQMAKAAGVRAIGVAWGYHPPADLTAAGADAIVQDYVGLDTALDSLWPVVNHA
jgi:phosphoglycolate phosphatase